MNGSIKVSQKHGVNPSLMACFICGKEYGVALMGRLPQDAEAPRKIHQGHCDECEGILKNGGHFFIEVQEGADQKNPYRTGQIWGVTNEAWKRFGMDPKNPVCYIEVSAANKCGLGEHRTKKETPE